MHTGGGMAEIETTLSYNRFLPPGASAVSTLLQVRRGSDHRAQDEQLQLDLRLWTPLGGSVRSVRQVEPVRHDLTGDRAMVSEQVGVYPLAGLRSEPITYVLDIDIEPDEIGCEIITVTNDVIEKLKLVGKDLTEYSRETVQMFYRDATAAAFQIGGAKSKAKAG